MDRKLKVIPKPKEGTRTVLVRQPNQDDYPSIVRGTGDLNLLCGYCHTVLAEGIAEGQIRNMVLKCPVCNNYNNVP